MQLIRPANSVMVGFAVVVGIAVTSNSYSQILTMKSLLGFLTGFCISSFSMISNDIYDLSVDKINQPTRPLACGAVSMRVARALCLFFVVAGLSAALFLSALNLLIAAIFAVIGWYYNYQGKKHGLFGNSLVALSLAIPYIFGSIAIGVLGVNLGYLLALTSFLAGLGREVLKGIADMEGDRARNIRTVAISRGANSAKRSAAALFLLAVFSSSLPILFGLLGHAFWIYVALISVPDGIFLYLTFRVLSMKQTADSLKHKSTALVGMMAGLLAYLVSGILV